jgi:hypothetical protein
MTRHCLLAVLIALAALLPTFEAAAADPVANSAAAVDFNRDIRSILSNNCFTCHGPDEKERQAGLRLDSPEGTVAELESGQRAVVPGKPAESELIRRVTSPDPDLRMPPAETGKKLSPREIGLLTDWVRQGATYSKHWSYVKPVRPHVPNIAAVVAEVARLRASSPEAQRILQNAAALERWPKNPIDNFLLQRLLREGLAPSGEADRYALVRRVSLDLTGLPPTLEDVDRFVADADPQAYEKLVDRLLDKTSYGEHWARMWLDLARYADSAGYADDPPRTIWAYRDWVIRSLNANQPFDQFTIDQLAGDLLPNPAEDQLIATAFHRNTLTNNEGGTNDEEFRNVAIVDRVNTTMAVWMSTTIDCCQCHNHKYDPLSQEEYFRLFAIFNNTDDADRRDESPLVELWSDEQKQQKAALVAERDQLKAALTTATPELLAAQAKWEQRFTSEPQWLPLRPASVKLQSAAAATVSDDDTILVPQPQKTDIYNIESSTPLAVSRLTALRLEALPHESLPNKGPGHAGGNFVVTRVLASIVPPAGKSAGGRYIRVEIPGSGKILSLAEVQVFSGAENVAPKGDAKQSSTAFDGPPNLAIDGKTDGNYNAKSVTHTNTEDNPWWELDLKSTQPVDRIALWNRTDNGLHTRLKDFRISLLDEQRQPVWEQTIAESPNPSAEFSISGVRGIKFTAAFADFAQSGFDAANVLDGPEPNKTGWAVGPQVGQPHTLTLVPSAPLEIATGSKLAVQIEQLSTHANHTLGRFRLSVTADAGVSEFARTPPAILAILKTPAGNRNDAHRAELATYFLTIADELKPQRDRLASVEKQLAEMKPATTTPIMRELAAASRRKTHIQHRGNFLDLGQEVTEGVPAVFHPLPSGEPANRLALARWLVDENNPLTPRVIANRYWEAIFGRGLVATSEEFGTQGELPTHPELLDWLATELIRLNWDRKAFLKLLVTSAAYRQSSRVTPELVERDPENILLARGPRFRLSAEMIRDQALFIGGLLSPKLYGPPVKPPQPQIGLSAAFGSGIDWQTSDGADRYRRGLYTTWRRSNPYPSMAAFDAPNREVCTVRRARTNTPLQALVTLNDPVYIEAAQALARRVAVGDAPPIEKARLAFRICLSRPPSDEELNRLVELFEQAKQRFAAEPEKAQKMATNPLGPAPDGVVVVDLAAWTVVGNVLLNLDEMFMKR